MNIILLAAGLGRRMGAQEEGLPKVLFRIAGGGTILETNLDKLAELKKPPGVVLVTGYQGEQVSAVVERYVGRLHVRTVFNARFDSTGPAVSAQLGLGVVPAGECVAVANGDTLFSLSIFQAATTGSGAPVPELFVSRVAAPSEDDIRVRAGRDQGVAIEAAKTIPLRHTNGVSAGLYVAGNVESARVLRWSFDEVVRMEARANRSLHWHNAIKASADSGYPPRIVWVPREEWQEFDAPSDISRYAQGRQLERVEERRTTEEITLPPSR